MVSSPVSPIVAIGEVLWDLLPAGPRLGGAPTNFALLTTRLCGYAALISAVGDDELGAEATRQLQSLASIADEATPHLDLSGLQIAHTVPTGTVTVALDEHARPKYTIHAPAAWDAIELTPALSALARSAAAVCLGTLAQRAMRSRHAIRSFVQSLRPDCVRIVDINLRSPFANGETLEWCMSHADVLKISDEELPKVAELLGRNELAHAFPNESGVELSSAATEAAYRLLELAPHCRLVAITLGPNGSLLADRTSSYRHHGIPTQVVDTVGAGDAFTAGLAHGYLRGLELAIISQIANTCGSFVASQPGATPELPFALLQQLRGLGA
jgi:fructokinase